MRLNDSRFGTQIKLDGFLRDKKFRLELRLDLKLRIFHKTRKKFQVELRLDLKVWEFLWNKRKIRVELRLDLKFGIF